MNPMYQSDQDHERDEGRPTKYEMQEYHDFLEDMMDSSFWDDVPVPTQQAVVISRDMLCWALGHKNQAFAQNIRMWAETYKGQSGWQDKFIN